MKDRKIDKLISLSPLVIAALIPVGRFVFGKILKKQKEQKQENINNKP